MEKQHVKLSEADRATLQSLASNRSLTVKIHKRVESLLALDSGGTFTAVAQQVGLSFPTLRKLCTRYGQQQLGCLADAPRPGRPIEITGEERARITALACSSPPEGHDRWGLRLLADKAVELGLCQHLSHVHARTILKKTNYGPISGGSGA